MGSRILKLLTRNYWQKQNCWKMQKSKSLISFAWKRSCLCYSMKRVLFLLCKWISQTRIIY